MDYLDVVEQVQKAKLLSKKLAILDENKKNQLLEYMSQQLEQDCEKINAANKKDVDKAKKEGLSGAMIDRLTLDKNRILDMVEGVRKVALLEDPVKKTLKTYRSKNGLLIKKVSTPIGVIGMIYESRPNVTSDVAALCIKSGNVVILKGGKEAFFSNQAIVKSLHLALKRADVESGYIQMIEHTHRDVVDVMLKQVDSIDLIVPRGGTSLIQKVVKTSLIPILKHDKGLCHIYIDDSAKLDDARDITINAKCQRPGVCNALETLLVSEKIEASFLKDLVRDLQKKSVQIRACQKTLDLLQDESLFEAFEEDWETEYLDLILSIKIVENCDEAISHINKYGSGHSDAIITESSVNAEKFLSEVDSSTVYHNASTRFTDGEAFGMGAEIGISTNKLHARGPVGLEELTSYKYVVHGDGQVRE
ncbi:glutamate-5-semialdehyde dehydrogenase [PVC group bacterium (ex Bugula neritina AB1)]|nr:glutamate-5-semialdehyde dehydrogenase [PVC group bacterium (ex Bugula neritina AB1)]